VAARAQTPVQVLRTLRKLALSLPETSETKSWGYPHFKAGKRIFVAFHPDREDVPSIWFRVEPLAAELLAADPRLSCSSHGATHWARLRADRAIDWRLVEELARDAHELLLAKPKRRASRASRT
jgi:predicted DNA-binding protein (MmcQ/YjbR family)